MRNLGCKGDEEQSASRTSHEPMTGLRRAHSSLSNCRLSGLQAFLHVSLQRLDLQGVQGNDESSSVFQKRSPTNVLECACSLAALN